MVGSIQLVWTCFILNGYKFLYQSDHADKWCVLRFPINQLTDPVGCEYVEWEWKYSSLIIMWGVEGYHAQDSILVVYLLIQKLISISSKQNQVSP